MARPSAPYAMIAMAVAALILSGAQAALADAMRCSGEQKTCIANCAKSGNRALAAICITNCRTRGSMCMHSGCWDNGQRRYCGLMRN